MSNNYFDVAFNKEGSDHYHNIRISARGPVRHLVGKAFGEFDIHGETSWHVTIQITTACVLKAWKMRLSAWKT